MSIPLDRLYHYIQDVAEQVHGDRILIYRFSPHGSKNIEDLTPIQKEYNRPIRNDLCFEFFEKENIHSSKSKQ